MTRLKRWESPRREGRNHKGRGGSARKRQRQKQFKNLAKRLKQDDDRPSNPPRDDNTNKRREENFASLPFFIRHPTNGRKTKRHVELRFCKLRCCYGVLRSITAVRRSTAVVKRS
jgi:hypothetical protein